MAKITVKLETVTPLFLGGAEPRGEPELRPPAFRGAMRYWLRAALGGVYGDDLAKIRTIESTVFGSPDETGGASAIILRLGEKRKLPSKSFSQIVSRRKVPKREGGMKTVTDKPGTAYLFFAARETIPEPVERRALEGEFDLILSSRYILQNKNAWKQAYASLWLLTHFGGLGTRIHRGAGAIQVKQAEGDSDLLGKLPLNIQSSTPEELARELQNGLHSCFEMLGYNGKFPAIASPSKFDILHPQACRIWVIDKPFPPNEESKEKGWQIALEEIGGHLQKFRNRREKDYSTVKNAVRNKTQLANPVERVAFGLPLPFFFNSLGKKGATITAILEDPKTSKHIEYERRASPLWIRPIQLANGECAIVLLWFQSEFLPNDKSKPTKLSLSIDKVSHKPISGALPGDTLLSTFLTGSDKSVPGFSLKDQGLSLLKVNYD